jgi:predicted dehydrogenase
MVNLTYRNSPALQHGRRMLLNGDIGAIRHVDATHLQSWLVAKAWGDWKTESKWLWRLSKKHGSNGALGDIGIHIVDFASYGTGLDITRVFGRLKTFDKALGNRIGEYDLDVNDCFAMCVDFNNGAIGTIQASRTAAGQLDQLRLRVYGAKGSLEMIYDTGRSYLRGCIGSVDLDTANWRDIPCDPVETNYRRVVAAVRAGRTQEPSFRRAADIQRVLDLAQLSDRGSKDIAIA